MSESGAFLKYTRKEIPHRPVAERIKDFRPVELSLTPDDIGIQALRCSDCGIPFCHGAGCPLKNRIPEFNEFVAAGQWQAACDNLHSTNNFPEFTGHVCPAPCEYACTLAINDQPVLIRHIELQIVERGFAEGWIKPLVPSEKSGKKVAVIGSGPAGLAAAQQLARAGHSVVVFEKDDKIGGLLRYGIPDFKLEKNIIDRRINQLIAEGVQFQTELEAGADISAHYLNRTFDCICLAMGAGKARDLAVQGRGYENIVFALDYLKAQNVLCGGDTAGSNALCARNKRVLVIGGGDTGSDCVGTARRQGAKEIRQLEILPKPPDARPADTPWPAWPRIMRTSSSHEEGCLRQWSVMTTKFTGAEKQATQLHACRVEWKNDAAGWKAEQVPGSDFVIETDLVILAMGFTHIVHEGLVRDLQLQLDEKGNIAVKNCHTGRTGVFAAGDAVSGAALVVNAIESGRRAADAIDRWLKQNLQCRNVQT